MNSLVAVNDLKPFDLPETSVKSEPPDYVQCLPKTNISYRDYWQLNTLRVLAAFYVGVYWWQMVWESTRHIWVASQHLEVHWHRFEWAGLDLCTREAVTVWMDYSSMQGEIVTTCEPAIVILMFVIVKSADVHFWEYMEVYSILLPRFK